MYSGRKKLYISTLLALVICPLLINAGIHTSKIYRDDKKYHGDIIFSRESGFYEEPFLLYLDTEKGDIYYTLDGSTPDRSSIRYDGPIYIDDATGMPNVYSARTDLSKYFYEDLVEAYVLPYPNLGITNIVPEYAIPDYSVPKCTMVRAVAYDDDGAPGEVISGSYFVGTASEPADDEILTISIITDPENLYDYNNGIYVTGRRFDEFFSDPANPLLNGEMYGDPWPANYTGRVREWERETTVQFFKGKELFLTQEAGIRIQGGFSREMYPKSLNLYARKEYDGNTRLHLNKKVSLCPDRLTITNGGEDIYSKMRDPLVSELCSGMEFATQDFTPCELYLDGEYWGFYFLADRFGGGFLQNKYSIDADNIVYVKPETLQLGSDNDFQGYLSDMEFISNADMTVPENYNRAQEIMDITSFIDYMAAEIYIARWYDWPGRNYAMWKSRAPEHSRYGDCRWRFLLYDVNWGGLTYDDGDATRDTIAPTRSESPLLGNMLNNPEFKQKFIDRLMEMRDKEFEPELVSARIDEYVRIMEKPMSRHYKRFFGTDSSRFYEEAEKLKLFFTERYDYIPDMIAANF